MERRNLQLLLRFACFAPMFSNCALFVFSLCAVLTSPAGLLGPPGARGSAKVISLVNLARYQQVCLQTSDGC